VCTLSDSSFNYTTIHHQLKATDNTLATQVAIIQKDVQTSKLSQTDITNIVAAVVKGRKSGFLS